MKQYYIIVIVLTILFSTFLGIQSASGQYTSLGREFFITLYSHNGAQQFALVSKHNTTVDFHFFADPSNDFSVALTGGTVEIIELTGDLAAISNLFASDHIDGDIDNKSLQITSDEDINVIHLAGFLAVEDASLIYPVQQPLVDFTLDTFYTVSAFMEDLPVSKTSTMIVSHYDCVTIEITPSAAYLGISAGVPFTVTLDKGETYTFADTAFNTNLSGSRIRVVSSLYKNPISVYAAQDVVYIAYPWLFSTLTGICCVDRIYEQLLPVQTFGTTFHVVPPFYGVLDDPI